MDKNTVKKDREGSRSVNRRSILQTSGFAGLLALIGGGHSDSAEAKVRRPGGGAGENNGHDPVQSGTYVAQTGEVQAKLNAARDDSRGVVRLSSGSVYDPPETWRIWDDVTLDYNGAEVG